MFQFDPTTGSLVVPIWISATVAAVLVVLAILALARSGTVKTLSIMLGVIAVIYGGWVASTLLDRAGVNDRLEEYRAFSQRSGDLMARALIPGSPLGCLDSAAGEQVDGGCEKIVFGSPENVAAAVSFVSARIALLVDGLDYAGRSSDVNYETPLAALRRGLDADRFGIVAHVFLQRESCTAEQCEALALLNDPNHVRANLQDKPFDALVARYAPNWPAQVAHPGPPPVAEGPKPSGVSGAPPSASGAPVSSKFDFPSSASIPPVSIMNPEPASPPATGTTTTAPAAAPAPATSAAVPAPPVPPRRPPAARAPVARAPAPPPPSAEPPPVQLTPAAPSVPQRQSVQ